MVKKSTFFLVVFLVIMLACGLIGCIDSAGNIQTMPDNAGKPVYVSVNNTWASLTNTVTTNLTGALMGNGSYIYVKASPELLAWLSGNAGAAFSFNGQTLQNVGILQVNGSSPVAYNRIGTSTDAASGANDLLISGNLFLRAITYARASIDLTGNMQVSAGRLILDNAFGIQGVDSDGSYWHIRGRDTGVGMVNLISVYGAANPYLSFANGKVLLFYDAGQLQTTSYIQFDEMTPPGAGAADTVRVYAHAGGDNLTDLSAVFQDGTIDTFAQETTPLDSPIFKQESGSIGQLVMIKPHPGLIQFMFKYSGGEMFELRRIEYHDPDKITANKNCLSPNLPPGWLVETPAQREIRLKLEYPNPKIFYPPVAENVTGK